MDQLNQVLIEGNLVEGPIINAEGTKVTFYVENKRKFKHDGEEHDSTDTFEIVSFNKEKSIVRLLKYGDRVLVWGVMNMYRGKLQIIAEKVVELKKSL